MEPKLFCVFIKKVIVTKRSANWNKIDDFHKRCLPKLTTISTIKDDLWFPLIIIIENESYQALLLFV